MPCKAGHDAVLALGIIDDTNTHGQRCRLLQTCVNRDEGTNLALRHNLSCFATTYPFLFQVTHACSDRL